MRKLFTLFVALLATTSLWASYYANGLYYTITNDTLPPYTVSVRSQTSSGTTDNYRGITTVTIPDSVRLNVGSSYYPIYKTFQVTGIAGGAFCNAISLTSVQIGKNVRFIGYEAFRYCNMLSSVSLPDSLKNIAGRAFWYCRNLTSIIIPNGVNTIGAQAFLGCELLSDIKIPKSVTSVGERAFKDTPWYNNQPDGVIYVNNILHNYKGQMPENTAIVVKNGTATIGEHAFDAVNTNGSTRYNLTSITIPNSVKHFGYYAFCRCDSLKITNYEGSISEWCTIEFGGDYANPIQKSGDFYIYDEEINDLIIPNNVKRINADVFAHCNSIHSLTIGDSVTYIGANAFANCVNLDTIYILSHVPPTIQSNTFEATTIKEAFVHLRCIEAYENLWSGIAEKFSPLKGYALFDTKTKCIETTQTTATINAIITNTDSAYSYNVGYISREDTVYLEYSDTLEFIVKNLYPNQSNQIILFVGKTDEPFDYYVFKQINVQTKSVNVNVQVPTITQTTAKITLSCSAGDATAIEQGIIFTHPNKQTDTIPFEINQTDTILTGLAPGTSYSIVGYCKIIEDNKIYTSKSYTCTTKDVEVVISDASQTQTTLNVGIRYNSGDATVIDKGLVVHFPNGNIDTMSIWNSRINNDYRGGMLADTLFTNLRVNTEYDMYGFVRTKEGGLKIGNGNAIYTKNIESTITSLNRTQTTISLSASLGLGDATDYNKNGLQWTIGSSFNSYNYETIYFKEGVYNLDTTLTHLSPNTQYAFRLFHYSVDETGKEYCVYGDTRKFTTSSVVLYEPKLQTTEQTYIEVQTSSAYGDATLVEEVVEVATSKYNTPEQRVNVAGRSNVIINNLMPDTKYYFRSVLTTQEAGTMQSEWYEATTEEITLATGDADGISNSSAFLHGTIDCDTMSRTEIGFEWKRSDAPSTVKPQRLLVVDRVDENLIFRLEGLSSDRYYDFRTFCLYNGKEYYGEWVGFLTSDKDILIPPSVQTREAEITDLGVLMKGFVVAGTEVILQRGFECWREESDQVATTVAEGAIMSSYIPEAWSYTTYKYRAYAKTPAGTTYGETLEVTTEYIATNIADIIVNASSNSAQVTWTMVEQADYYILTLYSDESMTEVIAVYTVDKNGNVTQKRVASATQSLVTCELTELLPETNYYFAVKAYNSADQMVAEENGAFATTQIPTSVENTHTQSPMTNCKKILRDGQLLILRDGKTYNAMGVLVE